MRRSSRFSCLAATIALLVLCASARADEGFQFQLGTIVDGKPTPLASNYFASGTRICGMATLTCPHCLALAADTPNVVVVFEFSIDDGVTWEPMGEPKPLIHGQAVSDAIDPGKLGRCEFRGTLQGIPEHLEEDEEVESQNQLDLLLFSLSTAWNMAQSFPQLLSRHLPLL